MFATKLKKWLRVSLRNNCVLCDANLIHHYREAFCLETIIDVCLLCQKQITSNVFCCFSCALPLTNFSQIDDRQLLCGSCQKQKPLWTKALTSFIYEYPIDRLLIGLKYQCRMDYAKPLARMLIQDINLQYDFEDENLIKPDCIVPVPLHLFRETQRGYNQSYLIARELARQLLIPLQTRLISRIRKTPQQSQLSKKQRTSNLRKAFAINASEKIPSYVALVDDVMTTGSTAHTVTKTLLDAGVQRVDVWCVARAE